VLSESELQTLWRRAALARQTLGAFVKHAALQPQLAAAPPVLEIRMIGRLGRVAMQLREVVRRCEEEPAGAEQRRYLLEVLAELRALQRSLIGLDRSLPPEPR
jgi:hypothetical protein